MVDNVRKNQNRILNFFNHNQLYLLSFFIPFITMMIIFAGNLIFPFGDRSFLHIDMYHQYFPFLTEFFHKLRSGDSLFYSWNTGIGSNFVALYAYYLASPINWLCILCPEKYLMEFMSYLIVIKVGLCGFTFAYYTSKHFHTKNLSIAFFGCFYAMSGYMAAYNWNVMWLDCIVLAPIIILGLELLVNEGKYKLYCISLAVAILSNYYLCIMICIFLVLYFLMVLLPNGNDKLKACYRFSIFSLLAGGMAAMLLIPEVAALQLSKFSSADFPTTVKTYFSVFDVLARHCTDVAIETGLDHWPNLYCSVAVMFLFPIYITCKNIPTNIKIGKLSLLVFMLISFVNNTLNFIWHGMNYPDSLPCRQSFLYIFLLLTVCFEAFMHIKETSKAEISRVFLGVLIFIILCQKLVTDDAFTDRTFLLTTCFLIIYSLLIHKYRDFTTTPKVLIFIGILVIVIESGTNMLLTSVPTVSRTNYFTNYNSYHTLQKRQSANDDGKFYRYEKDVRVTNNDAMLQNYPSSSLFSSTSNGLVNAFYDKYGLKNSKVFYSYEGATPFTSALLSTRYLFSKDSSLNDSLIKKIDTENDISLYENTYSLPLGFMIYPGKQEEKELIEDEETAFSIIRGDISAINDDDMLNPVERQNLLAVQLGATGNLYDEISVEENLSSATISVPFDSHIYGYCNTTKITALSAFCDDNDMTFKKMKNKRIIDLGYQKGGSTISLNAEEDEDLNLSAYVFHEDVFADLMNKLNQDTMDIKSFHSTKIKSQITASKDGYLILSIPYDPGFKITIDGKETKAELFKEMMVAVPVTTGTHDITIHYYPQGLNLGIIISFTSLAIFILIIFFPKIKNRKRRIKDN